MAVTLPHGVGIAADYGMEGRSAIPGRGKIFLFSTASTQPPIQWVQGTLFLG
jgi:hypothetical protein